jgi:glycosyltransferase involved in cell wall biosynthesis
MSQINSKITVQMIVKNEEQWIWYALNSVIDYVDEILISDTGSSDKTTDIIQKVKSPKIKLQTYKTVTPQTLLKLRNEQLRKTQTGWFMLVDGDEVWTQPAMLEAISYIKNAKQKLTALVSPCLTCLGDLFHKQENRAGRYKIVNQIGHMNIRFYRKQKDYKWKGNYPLDRKSTL